MRRFVTLFITLLLACLLALTAYAADNTKEELPPEEEQEEALDPKVEAMLAWALEIAEDNSHGYSQVYRYGPDYDCTSFVSTALMEGFGLDHYLITGGMLEELPDYGFVVYRSWETEPQKGDLLIRLGVHAEICMGDGGCVAAHQDYDGWFGDRTGHEIEYRTGDDPYGCPFCKYRQYTHILRYEAPEESEEDMSLLVSLLPVQMELN